MYKVYADNTLIYDSTLDDYAITSGEIELEINKSGSFTFSIYDDHPYFSHIQKMKTIVTVYKRDRIIFRGRVITDALGFFKEKTFTCEGELGFLLDTIQRPYTFQGTPADLLKQYIDTHNAQVEEAKQFEIGTITVTDPNDYITRSNSAYEDTLTNINDRLIDLLGGYFYVSRNAQNGAVLNYYEDSPFLCEQKIEFGENLLDFVKTDSAEEIATAIIPLGAKIEEEEETQETQSEGEAGEEIEEAENRVTIESVNDGKDYIYDQEAVDTYGWIWATETWDDVTEPANLKRKAEELLAQRKLQNITIEISAIDLADMDASIDDFEFFSYIQIVSQPHDLDDKMLLQKMNIDLLNPDNDKITLGHTLSTFTDQTASNAGQSAGIANRVEIIESDYATNAIIKKETESLQSLISQTSGEILQSVSREYATAENVNTLSTTLTQTINGWSFDFSELTQTVNDNASNTANQFTEINKYIKFVDGNIVLGEDGNLITLRIENDKISFLENDVEVAYFADRKLYVTDGEFINSLRIGKYAFIPRKNGNLSFKKVVE